MEAPQLTNPFSSPRGGAPPGLPGPGGGPGTGWGGCQRPNEPPLLEMLPGTAQEDFLGRGGGAVRVFLLGGLHAACQADLQEVRCSLHLDVVCHQLELSVFPVVLRGARLQVGGEAVCEAEIQVGSLRTAGPELWAAFPSPDAAGLSWQPALCWAGGSTGERSQSHLLSKWSHDWDSLPPGGGKHQLPVSSTLRTPLYKTKGSIF